MKKFVVILFVLSSLMTFAQGQKNFLDVNYIEVTGKSIKEIVPDKIYLNIIVREKDNKRLDIEKKEKEIMRTLKSIGVDVRKDFSVKDFSSNFQHYFIKRTDIKKMKEYEVIVHSGVMAGKVLDAMESIGVANVSIDKLRHSKIEEIRMQAKIEAVRNAKQKATLLTKELGQTVGRTLYLRENGDYTEYPMENRNRYTRQMMLKSSAQSDEPAQIEFQKIRLEYSVTVRFEI